jgi:hypothetical protein
VIITGEQNNFSTSLHAACAYTWELLGPTSVLVRDSASHHFRGAHHQAMSSLRLSLPLSVPRICLLQLRRLSSRGFSRFFPFYCAGEKLQLCFRRSQSLKMEVLVRSITPRLSYRVGVFGCSKVNQELNLSSWYMKW